MFPLPFFLSFFQVIMSQDRIVTYFHEYVMKKKYEVLALYIIAIVKVVAKCSIMVTKKKKKKPTTRVRVEMKKKKKKVKR